MAGAGLDAYIVYSLDSSLKRKLGQGSLLARRFQTVWPHARGVLRCRVNGREYQCSFALISKVRNYGGDLEIAQAVSLLDDEFEVVLFHGRESWRYVGYLAAVAARRLRPDEGYHRTAGAAKWKCRMPPDDRVFVQVDGEFAGHLPARVEIVPDSLQPAGPSAIS